MIFKKKTPLELVNFTNTAQSESIQRAMAPVLGKELQSIISQFSTCKPDLGMYSYLAGQAFILNKILNSVKLTLEEAQEAAQKVRREGF